MQKPTSLPSTILALIGAEPFMARVYELMDSNLDEQTVNKTCRSMVRYYFKLKEPEDIAKINAVMQAIHIVAIEPTRDENLIAQADIELARAFTTGNKNNFKDMMKTVSENVQDKNMRPFVIPKTPAPPLPHLPVETMAAQKENTRSQPSHGVADRLSKSKKVPLSPSAAIMKTEQNRNIESQPTHNVEQRPSEPKTIPFLAQYSKKQSDNLNAIKVIDIKGKFTLEAATAFIRSQRGSPAQVERGYKAAAKALGIDGVIQYLEKLTETAIKSGDQEDMKNVVGFVNEMKALINAKKSELDGMIPNANMKSMQQMGAALAVLSLTEQKIETLVQDCKMNIQQSQRASRG